MSFYWDPKPEIFTLPIVHLPILWYGVLFSFGFVVGFPLFVSILIRYFLLRPEYRGWEMREIKKKAISLTDRLTGYIVIATIVGARLGHFLFYEKPETYLNDPWEFFRVWEGGLASHGAVVAIILAIFLFSYRIRNQVQGMGWLHLLDFVSVPTAFVGCCIRIGNFFNQEILGVETHLPWAVTFGHPADRSFPVPRHPVQLYEAFFYLVVFFSLWALSYRRNFLLVRGRLVGLFLILVFGFRFLIEFLKIEQSHLLPAAFPLTMGQLLSIPVFLLGWIFFFWSKNSELD